MAYSKIEQAYLDGLVQNQFPDPVEPEPTLLASADTGITTDGGAYVGTRLNMPKGLNTPENMQAVGNDIPKTVAGVAKGMAQGFVGLPGDLESIGRLVLNYMGADVNQESKLPTTQDVKGFLDQYIKLPELQTSDMSNFETAGEWLAPGGQLKAIKPVAKAIKGAVKMTEGLPVGLSSKAVGQGVDELGFYSAVSKAADEIQQPKGTGEQFLAQITKTPGVKQDEIMWTGLDDFLKSKKTVTKQDVQDYLANNRVEIKEVQLGNPLTSDEQAEIKALRAKDRMTISDRARFDTLSSREDSGQSPKFSKYTLPGGENYREVLMTLPSKNPEFDPKDIGRLNDLSNKTRTPTEDVEYKALAQRYDASLRGETSPEFKSNHFDQPNILAHLRVNDRVDAEGKKVLMVEEVQSDWHQAGRKKGYQGDIEPSKIAYEKAAQASHDYFKEMYVAHGVFGKDAEKLKELDKLSDGAKNLVMETLLKEMSPEETSQYEKLFNQTKNTLTTYMDAKRSAVPDAPFKTTWQELAMKRAIQMAAEGGYERIAFTTGKTQAARYDLSKQIENIQYNPNNNNLFAEDKFGKIVIDEKVDPKDLPDVIGKDVADKLLRDESVIARRNDGHIHLYELSGQDLQVGGEGMAGFYDNILPKFLDKYAKKWDAKTGMTEIKAGDKNEAVHYIDITPKMRESVMTKGQPMFAIGAGGAGAATQQNQEKK